MRGLHRRTVTWALGAALASTGTFAFAQRPDAVPIVGVLLLGNEESFRDSLDAIRDGLRLNGLVDGVTVRLVVRYADGDPDRLAPLARELAGGACRLIVTTGTTSVRAVQATLPDMPIVMAGSADPVEQGFARSLARPGGKITGVSILGSELLGKRMELPKDLVPTAKTLAALLHAANPGNDVFRRAFATAAQSLNVDIKVREARTLDEVRDALASSARLPAGGVYVNEDPVFLQHRNAIFRAALAERLPTLSGGIAYVGAGALAAYAWDIQEVRRQAARYIAAILRGVDPGELPITQPTKFTS
jgi:putative ABC transport system substrate-binding protein